MVAVRQELCTSDHKPVYANFGIAVPKQLKQRIEAYNSAQPPACAPGKRIVVALRFKSLSVEGLHELTSGGAPNPRVNFFGTHRGELLEDSGELQSHARMKTTEATWSPDELKKMRLNCPSVALLGGTCESPSLAGDKERVAHSEAITLRFSSVPDDYDNKTKESKWLSDAMRKAGDHMGVNVGLTWPELGFCRLALRDFEPEAEQRLPTISGPLAERLEAEHAGEDGVTVVKDAMQVPESDDFDGAAERSRWSYVSRAFECELTLNGVGSHGTVKGEVEVRFRRVCSRSPLWLTVCCARSCTTWRCRCPTAGGKAARRAPRRRPPRRSACAAASRPASTEGGVPAQWTFVPPVLATSSTWHYILHASHNEYEYASRCHNSHNAYAAGLPGLSIVASIGGPAAGSATKPQS